MKIASAILGAILMCMATSMAQAKSARQPSSNGQGFKDSLEYSHFMKTTGLKEQEYKQIGGSDACDAGDLRVIKVDGGIAVVLGARGLVGGLDNGTVFRYHDRDMVSYEKATYSSGKIDGDRFEIMDGKVTEYHVSVHIADGQLHYTRVNTDKGLVKNLKNFHLSAKARSIVDAQFRQLQQAPGKQIFNEECSLVPGHEE